MSDESPSAREREEAEALARALEGDPGDAPADALEVLGLLRYARGEDTATREQLERARRAAERRPAGSRRRRIPVLMGALAAAAVLLLAVLSTHGPRSAAPPAPQQAPSVAELKSSLSQVLDAQAEVLRSPDAPLTGLSHASTLHRRDLLARLSERYGAAP